MFVNFSCGIKVMQKKVFSYALVVVKDTTGSAHWVKDPVEYDLGWIFYNILEYDLVWIFEIF